MRDIYDFLDFWDNWKWWIIWGAMILILWISSYFFFFRNLDLPTKNISSDQSIQELSKTQTQVQETVLTKPNYSMIERSNILRYDPLIRNESTKHDMPQMYILTDWISDNGLIADDLTCDWGNKPPVLYIQDIPRWTKTVLLIMESSDISDSLTYNLLVANIKVEVGQKTIDIGNDNIEGVFGINSFWNTWWTWPCKNWWWWTYLFKIYALTQEVDIKQWFRINDISGLLDDKIIAYGEIEWYR